jgi:serine/threonine protein kinase
MFKLISKTDVIPTSLFITNVKTDFTAISAVGIGGYGRVFKGEHQGQTVALKILDKAHKNVSA